MFWVCAEYSDDNRDSFFYYLILYKLLRMVHMEPKPFLLFLLPHWGRDGRCLGGWEETQPGQMTQTGKRDVPGHVILCLVHKSRERRWGMSDVICHPQ